MIKQIKGNLLREFGVGRLDVIFHAANIKNRFGAGLAKQIKERFPEAYEADRDAAKRNWNKLGNISVSTNSGPCIYNLYTQDLYVAAKGEKEGCMTDYIAMHEALGAMTNEAYGRFRERPLVRIGCALNIGCDLAGGDWNIVRTLLNIYFRDSMWFELTIVEWDGTIY